MYIWYDKIHVKMYFSMRKEGKMEGVRKNNHKFSIVWCIIGVLIGMILSQYIFSLADLFDFISSLF